MHQHHRNRKGQEKAIARPQGHRPLVVGHRGNSGLAPENTAAAFASALAAGADMIETDVRLSADGELFLFHDGTGRRTTNIAEVFPDRADDPITSFTAAQLRRLDAGSRFGEQFRGEPILFFSELPAAVDFSLGINLEIKAPAESPGVEQALAAALAGEADWKRLAQQQPIAVSSFDPASVRAFHEAAPDVAVFQLADGIPDQALLAGARWLQGVVANHLSLTAESAAAVRALDLGLWAYTVNGAEYMERALELGLDAVITDFPGTLVERLSAQP
ncbi:hypothetical protein J2M53_14165 [Arthrobacter sp. zg-ZUI100]|uniref:glycerophosphodiester phosphodiesterase n=1 Tax=Arthrobacter jiangjiafuii TaxID=2817475 RepID=UPI001AEDBE67|nr:glycerophosphodiester phosphodiesterase family protein [Arthrobacter jiangjiafuii]MBP3037390.1 hypothetical protein [Arthrobacter jiangjiafuii]